MATEEYILSSFFQMTNNPNQASDLKAEGVTAVLRAAVNTAVSGLLCADVYKKSISIETGPLCFDIGPKSDGRECEQQ
jgi:hypothetical protein